LTCSCAIDSRLRRSFFHPLNLERLWTGRRSTPQASQYATNPPLFGGQDAAAHGHPCVPPSERGMLSRSIDPVLPFGALAMDKEQVAGVLSEIGTLLELQGENSFRCQAYHNAARTMMQLEEDLGEVVRSGWLTSIPGIGATLRDKITTLVTTGRLPF